MIASLWPNINWLADRWAAYMVTTLLDATVGVTLVLCVYVAARRHVPPRWCYLLFLLVPLKLLVPIPLPLLPSSVVATAPSAFVANNALLNRDAPPPDSALPPREPEEQNRPGPADIASAMASATTSVQDALHVRPTIATLLMFGWASMVLWMGYRLAWNQVRLMRLLAGASRVSMQAYGVDLAALRGRLGICREIPVLASDHMHVPAVVGLMRPRIVLPAALLRSLDACQLECILAHELAHLRWHDVPVALIERLVRIVHFINPAVWAAAHLSHTYRENACDDASLIATQMDRRTCGATLLQVLEFAYNQQPAATPAAALFERNGSHQRRLRRIMTARTTTGRTSIWKILLLLGVTIVVFPNVRAAGPPDDAPADEETPQGDTEKPLTGRIFVHASFTTKVPGPGGSGLMNWAFGGILSIDPNTGKWSYFGEGFGPRVSPDGKVIAYRKRTERPGGSSEEQEPVNETWIYDIEAKRKTRLAEFDGSLCWSPDGKQLVSSTPDEDAEHTGTWLLSRDEAPPVRLPIPPSDQVADWSSDGQWLLSTSCREPELGAQLYRIRPDLSEQVRLTQAGQNVYPRFSPDGRRILYLFVDLTPEKSGYSLRMVDADGSNDHEILGEEEMASVYAGCWSPDGEGLATVRFDWSMSGGQKYLGGPNSHWRIEIMDAEGNNRRELKPADGKIHVVGTDDQSQSWFRLADGELRSPTEVEIHMMGLPDWR